MENSDGWSRAGRYRSSDFGTDGAMKKVHLNLGTRSYDILIGSGLSTRLHLKGLPSKRAFVVCDRALTSARGKLVAGLKKAGWEVHEIPVQAGEGLKDFKKVFEVYGELLEKRAHRDSVLFALGGGSVGDAAGFVAATYLRGIAWVGVPTTLLAQVDSSIGGKTAVNHTRGKNLIGAFHQPSVVLCDLDFLKTLSKREMVSGLGEALKYGLIYDKKLFQFISKNWNRALSHDSKVLEEIVLKSARFKARAVSQDEFDRKGVREFLNFGHTLGHALEEATLYKSFQHGEAVLWGMRFAIALSEVTGRLSTKKRNEMESFLSKVPLPKWPQNISFERLLIPLSNDKKVRKGKLHFVLLNDFGKAFSSSSVTTQDLRKAYELLMKGKKK
jgi:3-dehydroquinate synthase